MFVAFHVAFYRCLIYIAFVFYWVYLTITDRSILNVVSLILVLALYGAWLFSGLSSLIRYWPILVFWQAAVVFLIYLHQFFLQTPIDLNQTYEGWF